MIICSYDVSPGCAAQAVCFQALKTSAFYLAKPPRIRSNDTYRRVLGFLTRYRQLSDGMGEREPAEGSLAFDLPCSSCCYFCTRECERYRLFHVGWQEGIAQAEQLFEQMDLDLVEESGRAAGFTSRRPPRNYAFVSAWRDGADAKLHGEALRRFIRGWRQTGVDRRRIKGV